MGHGALGIGHRIYPVAGVPCSLFPIPCSLFPVPCSLFPVPYSLFPIPCSLFPLDIFIFDHQIEYHAMTDFDITQAEISQTSPQLSSSRPPLLSFLKILEYLSLAAFVCLGIVVILERDNQRILVLIAAALALWIFLYLLNGQLFNDYTKAATRLEIAKNAQLYTCLLGNNSLENNSLLLARQNALQYCQDLIDDYKKTRGSARNIYYISQISTIILSGITPILVLVDKLEASSSWVKWLPVIFPAIAAIVTSMVTSFPFQETWIAANATVELLEAEQEKFVLGVTQSYRCYDVADESLRQQNAIKAIENFIMQVNNIHLKQIQSEAENNPKEATTEQSQATESSPKR